MCICQTLLDMAHGRGVLSLLLPFAFRLLCRQLSQMLLIADTRKIENLESGRQVIIVVVLILFLAPSFLVAASAISLRTAALPLPRPRPTRQNSRRL